MSSEIRSSCSRSYVDTVWKGSQKVSGKNGETGWEQEKWDFFLPVHSIHLQVNVDDSHVENLFTKWRIEGVERNTREGADWEMNGVEIARK